MSDRRHQLVGYGVQRGRQRELDRIVQDLRHMLEDPTANEARLRAWCRELELRLDSVTQHVHELEHDAAANADEEADDRPTCRLDPPGERARDPETGDPAGSEP